MEDGPFQLANSRPGAFHQLLLLISPLGNSSSLNLTSGFAEACKTQCLSNPTKYMTPPSPDAEWLTEAHFFSFFFFPRTFFSLHIVVISLFFIAHDQLF